MFAAFGFRAFDVAAMLPNKRFEFAPVGRRTRKGEAPLLAAQAERWTGGSDKSPIRPVDSKELERS